jgi:uncharacterized protein YbjT (DUF2867 family)
MRVCIGGGSGKLGQYMIRHALDRGYEVGASAGSKTRETSTRPRNGSSSFAERAMTAARTSAQLASITLRRDSI